MCAYIMKILLGQCLRLVQEYSWNVLGENANFDVSTVRSLNTPDLGVFCDD